MARPLLLICLGVSMVVLSACDGRRVPDNESQDGVAPPVTACEAICADVRDELLDHFGISAHRVDCSDATWRGDCEYCHERIERDFDVKMAEDCQGRPQ